MSASTTILNLNVGFGTYASSINLASSDTTISGRIVGWNGTDSNGVVYKNGSSTFAWSNIHLRNIVSSTNASFPLNDTSAGFKGVTAVNGISGSRISIKNSAAASTGKVLSYLKFINDATTNTVMDETNIIRDDSAAGSNGFHANCKIALVMDGEGSQTIQIGGQFSGGVTMLKGTLLMNSKNGNASKGLGSDGITVWTHGDLEMSGGKFGFYYNTSTSEGGSYSFNNIFWTAGKLQLCVYDAGVDMITLDQVSGLGGALEKGEGILSDMCFDFIGAADSSYLETAERKVISWSSYDSDIAYSAEDIIYMGETYKAHFNAKEDGLYVQYVSVPEPATFAALFGMFAFALVFVRRRR